MSYLDDITEQECLSHIGQSENKIADALRDHIVRDVQAGDPDAAKAVSTLIRDACGRRVQRFWKRAKRPVKFLGSGRVRDVPDKYAIERVDPGATRSHYVQLSWQEFDLGETDTWYASTAARKTISDDTHALARRVRDAYHAHPQAPNAAEACRLAGLDPEAMEV